MGMTDLEALLRPVSDDAHCGPDLDAAGDPAYVEFGVAAERQASAARVRCMP